MEQEDLSLKTIYVAIPSLYDAELARTIADAFAKADHPERVFVGVAIQDDNQKIFKQLKKLYKNNKNVKLSFTKLTSKNVLDELGVGTGRAKSHSMYNDEDYVLQIDSHTMFEQGWDAILVDLHLEAVGEIQNDKIVLTAYAGHYFLDKDGERTVELPEGFSATQKFFYSLYAQFQRRYGVIPAASMVDFATITDADRRLFPASKFSANFAFGNKEFAKNLGLDLKAVFFEEEVIQSVNLLSSGFSLVFPNIESALVRHLYTKAGSKPELRKSSADYLTQEQERQLNLRQQENYLSFLADESLKEYRESYERYSNISLELGRQSASTLHPSTWTIDAVRYDLIVQEYQDRLRSRNVDAAATEASAPTSGNEDGCNCKTKHNATENHEGHSHDEVVVEEQSGEQGEQAKPKVARPWDLLNPNIGRVSDEVKKLRMDYCNGCEFFISLTQQCTKCGCHMPWKTGLPHASCPVGKWDAVPDEGN
jgi:hypothetical protein